MSEISKYGVHAVMGRPALSFGEIRRMNFVTCFARAHEMKRKAKSWAEFAAEYPDENEMLNEAMKAAGEDGE